MIILRAKQDVNRVSIFYIILCLFYHILSIDFVYKNPGPRAGIDCLLLYEPYSLLALAARMPGFFREKSFTISIVTAFFDFSVTL